MSELHELSYSELRSGLDSKKFSSVELTKSSLERANQLEHLNCFIRLTPEQALKEAAQSDQLIASGKKSALLGIPVGIKDVILTKGVQTTAASKILAGFVPPYDATVVRKLKTSGAVQ